MADMASRWKVVLGALLVQLCLGAIYAWSVFTPGLKDAGWTNAETQIVFSVGLAMFAIVMVFAGRKLNDWGPQRLAFAGGLTLGLGYLIAGLGSTRFAGDDRFTVNFGAGYRFLLTDSVALHLDFRDHLFDIDLLGEEKTVHNLEGHLGFTVFF